MRKLNTVFCVYLCHEYAPCVNTAHALCSMLLAIDRMLCQKMDAAVKLESPHLSFAVLVFDSVNFPDKSMPLDIPAPYNGMEYSTAFCFSANYIAYAWGNPQKTGEWNSCCPGSLGQLASGPRSSANSNSHVLKSQYCSVFSAKSKIWFFLVSPARLHKLFLGSQHRGAPF